MLSRRTIVLMALLASLSSCGTPQPRGIPEPELSPAEQRAEMQTWFQDARFGMFIHWGVYSVLADGEWVMHNHKMTIEEYEKLPSRFNPIDYNPAEWVALAKSAGMKYITVTSKHHDGFAMWDSKVSDYDVVDATPYGKDVLEMLARECEKQDMKLFLYHSHLDWHHPDYYPRGRTGQYSGRPDRGDFHRYLDYMDAQISELCSGRYGQLGGFWFDGWWDQQVPDPQADPRTTRVDWRLDQTYALINRLQPQALIGNNHHVAPFPGETFQMFEKDLPGHNTTGFSSDAEVSALPLETCETISTSWGYSGNDHNFKSTKELIHYLVKAAGYNSNFLLNIGPTPQGTIQPEFVERLTAIGAWMEKNGDSIYGTRSGPMSPQEWGVSTRKDKRVFVHLLDSEVPEEVALPGTAGLDVRMAKLLPDGGALLFDVDGDISLSVPLELRDPVDTIIVLELGD